VKYLGVELANFDYIAPYDYPNSEYEYASGKLSVSALYSFTVGGPGARARPRR
jgi:hypothetical protein